MFCSTELVLDHSHQTLEFPMLKCTLLQLPKFGSYLVHELWGRAQIAYVLFGADTEPQFVAHAPVAAILGTNEALLGQRGELLAAQAEAEGG